MRPYLVLILILKVAADRCRTSNGPAKTSPNPMLQCDINSRKTVRWPQSRTVDENTRSFEEENHVVLCLTEAVSDMDYKFACFLQQLRH